jgi:uncharacterized membrane protein
MSPYPLAFLIGVGAGLRALTPLAAVSWAARRGKLPLGKTPLAFLGSPSAPYIATALAVGELINDKLPQTPSRKAPPAFAARILVGALCGAALAWPRREAAAGAALGALGAVAGTLGGYELRTRLAGAAGNDLPIALLEDAVALGASADIVSQTP